MSLNLDMKPNEESTKESTADPALFPREAKLENAAVLDPDTTTILSANDLPKHDPEIDAFDFGLWNHGNRNEGAWNDGAFDVDMKMYDDDDDYMVEEKWGEEYYGFARDKKEIKRLHQQHCILRSSFNFKLHPTIPIPTPSPTSPYPTRIADFACGTGVWLIDFANDCVALSSPGDAQEESLQRGDFAFDGFDISDKMFPDKWIEFKDHQHPFAFHKYDVLQPLGEQWKEVFDVIHVRDLATVLTNTQWELVLGNLMFALKPGGWIQWVDADLSPTGFKALQSTASSSEPALLPLVKTVNKWAAHLGRDLNMSNELPHVFFYCGLEQISHNVMSTDNDASRRKETSVQLAVGLAPLLIKYAQLEGADMDVQMAEKLGKKMISVAQKGEDYLRMDLNIVIGRKPVRD